MRSKKKSPAHAGMRYNGIKPFTDLTKQDRQRAQELVSAIEHFVYRCDQIERNLHQVMNPVIRAFAPAQDIIVIQSAEKRRRITEILVDELDALGFETLPPSASDDVLLDDLGYKRLEEAFENCRFLLYRYARKTSSVLSVNLIDHTIFRVLKSAREIASDFLDIQSTRYWDSDCLAEPAYTKVLACLPERRLYRMAAAAEVHAAIDNLFINTLLLETQPPDTTQESAHSAVSDEAPEDIAKSAPGEDTKAPAKRTKRQKQKTVAGISITKSSFKPWDKPGEACFVLDGARVKFWNGEKLKDLKLRSGSKADKLLPMLSMGALANKEIKKAICTLKTSPYDAIRNINRTLNDKIKTLNIQKVPPNTAFIARDERTGQYFSTLPIKPYQEFEYD